MASPENVDGHERLSGPEGITVYLSRELVAAADDPVNLAFAFGPMGTCRMMLAPQTVLFACVHNAGRSQMAAAFFNALADPVRARAISAGTQPGSAVHPVVVAAMHEVGFDLSSVVPRLLDSEASSGIDVMITMGCAEECPNVPGVERLDWALPDPKGRPLEEVRQIRDDIRALVAQLIASRGWKK